MIIRSYSIKEINMLYDIITVSQGFTIRYTEYGKSVFCGKDQYHCREARYCIPFETIDEAIKMAEKHCND